ncbi:bifunctional diaminohydroxyphosphoribosylaminopyrimidine deaminase/5-amino-6-(5-phosphoribosylamino)uracil reductase RibD [Rhodobacter sp. SGA-6-6]|uniref:bifunctional diaminohydroxyphosphoribosylaminopyrimidine deaminase/5-amino-6-(5-phosphoribosylamino)uracil reductase RibD n=1 Tax=Rhodobacter sp. SGA-6-6 TaxID=2710882 RepID=UPI0013ED9DC6|nr:bifunctional diaminohydroxyphosphoribosylaminopyrimidine deaminase/5-amino-6-(5-phosphoribosylamino)uracil reductase RibD [Rhodobacter sp. SGA-6-6]NGM46445.1 bifunctional diaminohydroxyphosphoribosylaminopyrimidine deaminase/5-amino-6-(5-phosphoribosylamino)uracil reductase RibD [Rhodobacter sp. SGA-6-6]
MAHALRLAARGLGATWPNPAVGCVLVRDGLVIGRGTTQPGGRPHAERVALAQAGEANGATAYVTLEPCAHHGKTSPCAEALVAAGVARVVTALTDPDPRTAGRGHAILRAAGIGVTEGILAAEARRIAAGFLKRVTRGLPQVTLKLAATLDGRIATAAGESRWITGAQARAHVHLLRLTHDAVLVGSGTARADDPELTVRGLGAPRQPLRIVIDSRLSHSPDSRLGRTAREVPVWLLHTAEAPAAARKAWDAAGARLIECPETAGHVDLPAAFRRLGEEGLTRILCEGGGTLAAGLVAADLADDLALYSAGCLIGTDGIPALGPLGLTALKNAPRLTLTETRTLGPDSFSLWRF